MQLEMGETDLKELPSSTQRTGDEFPVPQPSLGEQDKKNSHTTVPLRPIMEVDKALSKPPASALKENHQQSGPKVEETVLDIHESSRPLLPQQKTSTPSSCNNNSSASNNNNTSHNKTDDQQPSTSNSSNTQLSMNKKGPYEPRSARVILEFETVISALLALFFVSFDLIWSMAIAYWHHLDNDPYGASLTLGIVAVSGIIVQVAYFLNK